MTFSVGTGLVVDRRSFFHSMVGGAATAAAVRTWPFRVYSFPTELRLLSIEELKRIYVERAMASIFDEARENFWLPSWWVQSSIAPRFTASSTLYRPQFSTGLRAVDSRITHAIAEMLRYSERDVHAGRPAKPFPPAVLCLA